MVSYYGGEYLVNFERYAQVLSQNFDVRIYLDGTKAETHQDDSIHLPNIKNMTAQELDCLYGVLLHEIGHVKYSRLSNLEMKKIKGRDHFFIWNAIEDARIENKLMVKLEGANDIFERMYGGQLREVFDKISGTQPSEDVDPWFLFSIHIHDYLLKTKKQYFAIDAYPQKARNAALDLFSKAKSIIDAHRISRIEDALSLSTKLFKKFGPKRADFMKEFSEVYGDLGKCQQELQDVFDAFKNNPKLIELKKKKKELAAKKKELEEKAEKTGKSKYNKEAEQSIDEAADMLDYLRHVKELNTLSEESARLRKEVDANATQIETLKKELAGGGHE